MGRRRPDVLEARRLIRNEDACSRCNSCLVSSLAQGKGVRKVCSERRLTGGYSEVSLFWELCRLREPLVCQVCSRLVGVVGVCSVVALLDRRSCISIRNLPPPPLCHLINAASLVHSTITTLDDPYISLGAEALHVVWASTLQRWRFYDNGEASFTFRLEHSLDLC